MSDKEAEKAAKAAEKADAKAKKDAEAQAKAEADAKAKEETADPAPKAELPKKKVLVKGSPDWKEAKKKARAELDERTNAVRQA